MRSLSKSHFTEVLTEILHDVTNSEEIEVREGPSAANWIQQLNAHKTCTKFILLLYVYHWVDFTCPSSGNQADDRLKVLVYNGVAPDQIIKKVSRGYDMFILDVISLHLIDNWSVLRVELEESRYIIFF